MNLCSNLLLQRSSSLLFLNKLLPHRVRLLLNEILCGL